MTSSSPTSASVKNSIPNISKYLAKIPPEHLLLAYKRGKTSLKVYCIAGYLYPEIMQQIGHLRIQTYADINAASHKKQDIDEKDLIEKKYYRQIIICHEDNNKDWKNKSSNKNTLNPKKLESTKMIRILAGCRVYSPLFTDKMNNHLPITQIKKEDMKIEDFATSHFFNFSPSFIKTHLPNTMDIGRMFIVPSWQGGFKKKSEGSFLLDALFHALARLIKTYNIKYMLGRVMLNPQLPTPVRHAVLGFLHRHHKSDLVQPKKASFQTSDLAATFQQMLEDDIEKNYQTMLRICKQNGHNAPALIRAYLSLSPSLHFFGSVRDTDLSSVEEVCIMIKSKDIYDKYRKRYLSGFPLNEKSIQGPKNNLSAKE